MKILCYIGARGGSKRLKNKNMQQYGEKTLIQHAVENALKSRYIDTILFDSEDHKMLNHVRKIKREADKLHRPPYLEIHRRKDDLSHDHVSLYDPVREILEIYSWFPIIVILQVDNPVESSEIIDRCIEQYLNNDDSEDVSTFFNGRRTGTVRVINKRFFFDNMPSANIYSIEDRQDFIDIHTQEDLKKANMYLKNKPHDTFQVANKIREPYRYNTQMIYNHFLRYQKAIELLNLTRDNNVLDASCGHGYGTYLLSLNAEYAVGLDINENHLAKAKKYYGEQICLEYHTYKNWEEKMSIPMDKIVCIETIEHLPKKELKPFINKLFSYLKPGGDMFITTPLGDDKPSQYNKHHLNEPSIKTLYALFTPYFKQCAFFTKNFKNSYNKEQEYCSLMLRGYGQKNRRT